MKTVRRTRRIVRTAGLVAVAATAAFSLTACQGDSGTDDNGSSSSSSSDATAKKAASEDSGSSGSDAENSGSTGSGSAGGGGAQDGKGDSGGADTRAGSGGSDVKRTTCDLGTVTVRLQETGGSAPVILLKATNRGDERCDLYGYPFIGYPDAQAPIQVGGDTPQAVVSLDPGKSAYSALSLEKGEGNNMHREKELTVELADRDQHGTGSTGSLTAPGAGLALSDDSTVSYWKTTPELAMQ